MNHSDASAPTARRAGLRLSLRACLTGLALLGGLSGLGGCSSFNPPQPWEKGTLARKDMTFEADALDQRYVQHIYFSKEAASGGYGVGGGGCGCN